MERTLIGADGNGKAVKDRAVLGRKKADRTGLDWKGRKNKIMKKESYKSRNGFRINNKVAEVVGKEISAIEKKFGFITPKILLDCAKSPKAALHKYFTWDNTKAAEQWRLNEARYLIRSVRIEFLDDDENPREVRAYVNITNYEENNAPDSSYVSIDRAMNSAEYKKQILKSAYDELQDWSARYEDLKEFSKIHNSIKSMKLIAQ